MTAQLRRLAGGPLAFGLLALYGAVRWATMLRGGAALRVYAALALALLTAWVLAALLSRPHRRWTVPPATFAAFVGLVALAGYPLRWLYELHLGRFSARVRHGISSLDGLLVPYRGHDPATPAVLILGAALLLLLGGLAFAAVQVAPAPLASPRVPPTGARATHARGVSGMRRRALAALPLLVLAIVPSSIVAPQVGYLHGVILFALLAAWVFAPQFEARRTGGAVVMLLLAAVIGAAAAAGIAGDHLWIEVGNGHSAGVTVAGGPVTFDWDQTYGRTWSHTGATVLYVTAPRATYWKSEDLDSFTGVRWAEGSSTLGLLDVSAANRAAYTERIRVQLAAMNSSQVVAAGYAQRPQLFGTSPGSDPGTWVTNYPLEPGNFYTDVVYAPDPSPAVLAHAGSDYPAALAPFRSLPKLAPAYAGVEALARSLGLSAATPYAYLQAVLAHLRSGYVYTLTPPAGGAYPLADFLLNSRRGYCQQFAGAAALLLRMRGIPARVAVGFTPGQHTGTDVYQVSDSDAHAWVEVWFPTLGWVTFDPTPGTAQGDNVAGTGGTAAAAAAGGAAGGAAAAARAGRPATTPAARKRSGTSTDGHGLDAGGGAGASSATGGSGSSPLLPVLLGVIGLLGLGVAGGLGRAYSRRLTIAELTVELERAFSRCGAPLAADVTLGAIEQRLARSPSAAAYVRSLSVARFAPDASAPSPRGRAALRRWLVHAPRGRGGRVMRWLRAFAALPPRRRPGAAPRP